MDHRRHPGERVAAVATLGALLTAALTGCTTAKTHSGAKASGSGTGTARSTKTAGVPAGITGAASVPAHVANDDRLRRNVALSTCQRTANGWTAAGTARNPTAKPVDYTITVFFTTAAATVIGTGATHLTVKPGHKSEWVVTPRLNPAPQTLCVLRGVG